MTAEQVTRRTFIAIPAATAATIALAAGDPAHANATTPVVECVADLLGDQ